MRCLLLVAIGCTRDPAGPPRPAAEPLPSTAVLEGGEVESLLGLGLATLGDVDGDGTDELAAVGNDNGVAVVWGSADRALRLDAPFLAGDNPDELASPVVYGGDLDGDGRGELVVAVFVADETAGWLGVSSWPDLSDPWFTLAGEEEFAFLGSSVVVDDLDGDGRDDLVGAKGWHGNYGSSPMIVDVRPWVGVWRGPLVDEPEMLLPEPEMDLFGPVRGVGDVDGDGYGDVAISSTDHELETSTVSLFHGSPNGLRAGARIEHLPWTGDSMGGQHQGGIGDVDGDGFGDMTVSWDYSRRYTYVLRGTEQGPPTDLSAVSELYDFDAGTSFPVGDLDDDGHDDLLVAYSSYEDDDLGRVELWYGGPDGLGAAPGWTLAGTVGGGNFGRAAAAGDFDGDGRRDLAISAPNERGGRGRIHVWFGG